MLVDINKSLLLIVDVQEKIIKSIHNKDLIIKNIKKLSKSFSILSLPILVTEQYPKGLGFTLNSIFEEVLSYNKIEKTTFSCASNKNFQKLIFDSKKKHIIICGIETHICILQTAIELKNMGFDIFVMSDAVGSRTSENYSLGIERLKQNNIYIIEFEMLLFELLRDSKHQRFRDLSNLIK